MGTVRYTVINGRLLFENRDGVKRDYLSDSLGTTMALVDNTQTKTDTFTYWPYWEERTRTGTTATPFRFVGALGYYKDASSRLYVKARVLDGLKGRWLTADTIGFEGGDANVFRYAYDNPMTYTDPSGLSVYEC